MAEFQDLEIRLQAVDNASKTLEKVVSLLERVKELTGSGGSATTSNTTNGTKAQVQSTKNLTDATKKAAETAQVLVDKEKLLLDATRGIKAAQEGSTSAQISLNKARNTASVNAQKYIDKEKALTSALERQAKAQENLKKAQAEQSRFESISGLLNQGKSVPTEDSTWLFQNQNTNFIGQVEKAQKELDAANKAVASSTLSAQSAYARYQNSLDSVQAAQIRVTNEQKRNEEQQKKLESQNNKTAFSFTTLASKISAITMTFRKVTNALFSAVEASGEFVGKIRFTVNEILADIINSCSVKSRLSLSQSLEVLFLCEKRYGTVPEYPWDDLQAAVLRNEKTRKWYGLIIAVSTDKLGLKVKPDPSYKTEILLLHHTKEDVVCLVDGINFIPAWHMNKKSWLACVLDGRLATDVIMDHIDISYRLSEKKI